MESKTMLNEETSYGKLVSCVQSLKSFVITKQPFKVGRAKNCDVILEHSHLQNFCNNVSKEHFILTKDPNSNGIYITDVSKNGTFINGKKIEKKEAVVLKDGNKIAVGHINCSIFTFKCLWSEDISDTPTPVSLPSPAESTLKLTPIWGRLVSCMMYLDSTDLKNHTLKVGRSSSCDIIIDQTNIKNNLKQLFSKEHFTICKDIDNSVAYITDFSKIGTYLNGNLIGKRNSNILQHDDVISVGTPNLKMYLYKCMQPHFPNDLPLSLKKKFEPTKLLGKGAVGEVRLAFEKSSCKMFAIKKILKSRSTTSQMHKMNHPIKIRSEINILRNLSHPFVMKLKDIDETPEEVFIVLEYMEGGELTNRILSRIPLSESNAKFLFYQIVLAVEFLHSKGITHRDLKPENVLLASEDEETLIKVSDFGLSKITDEDGAMQTVCGTFQYIAPEILKCSPYNKQVDVWSLGVILFYMLSKKLPFHTTDKQKLSSLIQAGDYTMDESWNSVSDDAKDLVRKMLIVNPNNRITISQIQKHPWLGQDTEMQNKVNSLIDRRIGLTEETVIDDVDKPSPKRIRFSMSDD